MMTSTTPLFLSWLRRAFLGACLAAGLSAAHAGVVNILPIQICNDAGVNCANAGKNLFLAESNKIWAQAGITLNYLPFATTNSSAFLSLDDQAEVNNFFNVAPGAAANPLTISMWFVDNHFDAFGEVNAIGGNKIVIDDVIFAVNRLDTIAHELGHLFGLLHSDPGMDQTFLMRSGDRTIPGAIGDITPDGARLDKLTAAQIQTAQASRYVLADVRPVPEPGTLVLLGSTLVLLLALRRRPAGIA